MHYFHGPDAGWELGCQYAAVADLHCLPAKLIDFGCSKLCLQHSCLWFKALVPWCVQVDFKLLQQGRWEGIPYKHYEGCFT